MTIKNRLAQLEKYTAPTLPIWADLLGNGRAVLRYGDGRRVEVSEDEIPRGVKVYSGWTPDDWGVRAVNYRAGIIEGVQDTPGAIPVKLVDYMRRNDEHKEQTSTTGKAAQ